jgi:hypothetical protein
VEKNDSSRPGISPALKRRKELPVFKANIYEKEKKTL